jgi:hypothetical protein
MSFIFEHERCNLGVSDSKTLHNTRQSVYKQHRYYLELTCALVLYGHPEVTSSTHYQAQCASRELLDSDSVTSTSNTDMSLLVRQQKFLCFNHYNWLSCFHVP